MVLTQSLTRLWSSSCSGHHSSEDLTGLEVLPSDSLTWLLEESFTSLLTKSIHLAAHDLEAAFNRVNEEVDSERGREEGRGKEIH